MSVSGSLSSAHPHPARADAPWPVVVVSDDLLGPGGESACEFVTALRLLGLDVRPATIHTSLQPSLSAAPVGPVTVLGSAGARERLRALVSRIDPVASVAFGPRALALASGAGLSPRGVPRRLDDPATVACRIAESLSEAAFGGSGMTTSHLPVSVVVPVHDRADVLERCVLSVRLQGPARVDEIVVVDDASGDDSATVAERLGCRVVRLAENGGAARARNAGLRAARNPWVSFIDSDDEWLPHHLATLWGHRFGVDLVAGCVLTRRAGEADRFEGPTSLRGVLRLTNPAALVHPHNVISMSAVMVRRDALLAAGAFDPEIRYSEDLDAWLRLLTSGDGAVVPVPTAIVHRHPGNKSMRREGPRESQEAIARSYAGYDWWSNRLVEGRMAAAAWDELRARLRRADRIGALERARYIVTSRDRLLGVRDVLTLRWANRRHSRRFAPDGMRRVAVLNADGGLTAEALRRPTSTLGPRGLLGALRCGQCVIATRSRLGASALAALGRRTITIPGRTRV